MFQKSYFAEYTIPELLQKNMGNHRCSEEQRQGEILFFGSHTVKHGALSF